jgi:serine/threonine protein kinase
VAVKVQSIPKMLKRAQRGGNGSEKEKLSLESVLGDVISLKFLRHENIVRLLDVKRKAQSIYIVMEYCNQKDLDVYMKARQFSEAEVRYYFAQILEAFKYLNKKQLMHRDIKP